MLARIERLLLIAGIGLLVFLISRIGLDVVLANLHMVGWGFVLVIGQEVLAYLANTAGWLFAFGPPRPTVRFARLLEARVVGDGINAVTPTATVGGEIVRARMIEAHIEPQRTWASVTIAKIAQSFGQILFILGGLLFVSTQIELPAPVRAGFLVGVPVLVSAVLLTVVLQRRGLFTTGVRLVERLGIHVPTTVTEALERLDREIRRVHRAPLSFALSSLCFLLGWGTGVLETYLMLYFLDMDVTWRLALTVEALGVTIDAMFFFVPAKAGTQEGGKVLIFTILGLDPAKGLSLGIVRRVRELSWAAVALLLMWRHQRRR